MAGAFEPIFTMTETRAACRSGVTHTPQGDCGGTPVRRLRPRAGSAGRSRERKSMRLVEEVLRSDRPLVERDLVRVLVACGQGQPCVRRKSLARAHKETRTAGVMRMTLARGAGREEMPSRHSSHSLRLSATRRGCSPIRPRGFVRRAAVSVASGTNGQEGSRPQRWGTATDEEQTFEGCSAGGNVDRVRVAFGRRRRLP